MIFLGSANASTASTCPQLYDLLAAINGKPGGPVRVRPAYFKNEADYTRELHSIPAVLGLKNTGPVYRGLGFDEVSELKRFLSDGSIKGDRETSIRQVNQAIDHLAKGDPEPFAQLIRVQTVHPSESPLFSATSNYEIAKSYAKESSAAYQVVIEMKAESRAVDLKKFLARFKLKQGLSYYSEEEFVLPAIDPRTIDKVEISNRLGSPLLKIERESDGSLLCTPLAGWLRCEDILTQ